MEESANYSRNRPDASVPHSTDRQTETCNRWQSSRRSISTQTRTATITTYHHSGNNNRKITSADFVIPFAGEYVEFREETNPLSNGGTKLMSIQIQKPASRDNELGGSGPARPGALLISGVVGTAILLACSISQVVHGEPVLIVSYLGVTLLLACLLTAAVGFAQIIDWTDPFPVDDPSLPEVRVFDGENR